MAARALIFADDENREIQLYACSGCGVVFSPGQYRRDGRPDAAAARAAAESCSPCRGYSICGTCGGKCEVDHVRCKSCQDAEMKAREDKRLAAAEETVLDGPCFSPCGHDFYHDVESARDAGLTVVLGAKFRHFTLDEANLVEAIIDDHHDDASEHDLIGLNALYEAVGVFNAEQTSGSYDMDEKVKQTIRHDRTFAMIKPDATARGVQERMIADIEAAGFRILKRKDRTLTREEAEWLYREHREREHFTDLVAYTVSGPVVLLKLQADSNNAAADFRALMGPTDRTKAEPHTLRARYAVGYRENSIHGSDSPAAAIDEMCRFFPFFEDGD